MFNKESEEWLAVEQASAKLRTDAVERLLAKDTSERDADFYRGVVFALGEISALQDGLASLVEIAAAPDY